MKKKMAGQNSMHSLLHLSTFFLLSEKACTIVKNFNRQPKHKIYWAISCNQNIIMENIPIAFIKMFISSFTGNTKLRHEMF